MLLMQRQMFALVSIKELFCDIFMETGGSVKESCRNVFSILSCTQNSPSKNPPDNYYRIYS